MKSFRNYSSCQPISLDSKRRVSSSEEKLLGKIKKLPNEAKNELAMAGMDSPTIKALRKKKLKWPGGDYIRPDQSLTMCENNHGLDSSSGGGDDNSLSAVSRSLPTITNESLDGSI